MIPWNEIDTVLLDMDGTLLDLHFDSYFWLEYLPQRYAQAHAIELPEAHATLNRHIESLRGTLQWYCLDHWSELVNMDIPALKEEIQHRIQLRPHTTNFLKWLRTTGKKTILATNAHRTGLDLKMRVTDIDQWLDLVVSSHDYQHPKEATEFWHELQQKEPFHLDRTLFIDDNVEVLRTAKAIGIKHLVCITQPDLSLPAQKSNEFLDILDFDEIIPNNN